MRIQRLARGGPGVKYLPTFSVLTGLLVAMQIWFAPVVGAAPTPTPVVALPQENLTRAGVSIVRVLTTYESKGDNNAVRESYRCTGLGVFIDSKPNEKTGKYQNVMLTDGSILVGGGTSVPCMVDQPEGTLTKIEIFTSSQYNEKQPVSFAVDPEGLETTIDCVLLKGKDCRENPVRLRFETAQNQPQPFIHFEQMAPGASDAGSALVENNVLELVKSPNLTPSSQGDKERFAYLRAVTDSRIPKVRSKSQDTNEAGTPTVNGKGELTGLLLGQGAEIKAGDIQEFLKTNNQAVLSFANPVHDNWEKGMDAFYLKNFAQAQTLLRQTTEANVDFQAGQHYAALAASAIGTSRPSQAAQPTPAPTPVTGDGLTVSGFFVPWWQVGIAGLAVLLVILLLIALIAGSGRRKRKQEWNEDLEDAKREAEVNAARIREMESRPPVMPVSPPQQSPVPGLQMAAPLPPATPVRNGVQSGVLADKRMLRCPRCNMAVEADATYCGNCRLLLSPTESGLHLRVKPEQPVQPATPVSPVGPSSVPLPQSNRASAPRPERTLEEQPTVIQAGPLAEQPTVIQTHSAAEQPTLVHSGSIADQPTIDMSQARGAGNANQTDLEKTVPFTMKQINGQRLGFAVGTRSDPGIKRKYKPNEDSLFAAQGQVAGEKKGDAFGLFVVADGMGGHANGEDASQLAIQTIINYVLPKVTRGEGEQQGYARVMEGGVQEANLAVHNNNMEQHGDMGTTVTAALVIGANAYVANVGDSRTYLYRPANGLQKVTTDHSVVASLVEAGIIKPDDIYTHPKRNQIYRSLGEKPNVEVDTFTVQLQSGDKLLLCSDGLWDMVRDPKIEEVIKSADPNPGMTGDALIHAALEGGGEDNVSVIVVHMTEGNQGAGVQRVQLLAKPDSVEMPQL